MRERSYQALEDGLRKSVTQRIESTPTFLLTDVAAADNKASKKAKGAGDKKKAGDSKAGQPETPPKPLVEGALATVAAVPDIGRHPRFW